MEKLKTHEDRMRMNVFFWYWLTRVVLDKGILNGLLAGNSFNNFYVQYRCEAADFMPV